MVSAHDQGFSTSNAVQLLSGYFHISSFYIHLLLCQVMPLLWATENFRPRLRPFTASNNCKKLSHFCTERPSPFFVLGCEAISSWCHDTIQLIFCEIQPRGIWCKERCRVAVVMIYWCLSATHSTFNLSATPWLIIPIKPPFSPTIIILGDVIIMSNYQWDW